MGGWKDELHPEIEKGGSEPPCPFCHVPRVRRSDYIRCCRCGINWTDGEALDKDPRNERLKKFLTQTNAMQKPKEAKNDGRRGDDKAEQKRI